MCESVHDTHASPPRREGFGTASSLTVPAQNDMMMALTGMYDAGGNISGCERPAASRPERRTT